MMRRCSIHRLGCGGHAAFTCERSCAVLAWEPWHSLLLPENVTCQRTGANTTVHQVLCRLPCVICVLPLCMIFVVTRTLLSLRPLRRQRLCSAPPCNSMIAIPSSAQAAYVIMVLHVQLCSLVPCRCDGGAAAVGRVPTLALGRAAQWRAARPRCRSRRSVAWHRGRGGPGRGTRGGRGRGASPPASPAAGDAHAVAGLGARGPARAAVRSLQRLTQPRPATSDFWSSLPCQEHLPAPGSSAAAHASSAASCHGTWLLVQRLHLPALLLYEGV